MNKFKLGIITCFLLGAIACSKEDNETENKEEEVFTEPLIKEATSTPEGDNEIVIKIVGSGFGTRLKKDDANAPYAPLLNSDFEHDDTGNTSQIGQSVADHLPEWYDRGIVPPAVDYVRRPVFSDEKRSAELTNNRSVRMTHIKTSEQRASPVLVAKNLDFKKTRKIFFSYWVKFKWPTPTPPNDYQYKLSSIGADISSNGTIHDGASLQLAYMMYVRDNGINVGSFYRNFNGNGNKMNRIDFPANVLEPTTDNWRQIVLFWNPGTPDKKDGKIWSWVSKGINVPIIQRGGLDKIYDGNEPMITSYDEGAADFPNSFKLAWYIGKLPSWNVDTYFDDVVADNSWAQIFIGDQPNFDDCSTLELQQVSDWKNDAVQFKLRYGSLAKNQALYVYIMNEGGLYNSAGFKILSN